MLTVSFSQMVYVSYNVDYNNQDLGHIEVYSLTFAPLSVMVVTSWYNNDAGTMLLQSLIITVPSFVPIVKIQKI